MRFLRAFLAALAAPFVMIWDGVQWLRKAASPAPIPSIVDEIQEALEAPAPVEPRRLGEVVHAAANAMLHGAPMPADVGTLPERIEFWLHGLTPGELARVLNVTPQVVEDHVAGSGHILRLPVLPSVQAYEARRAVERIDAEIAEAKRAYDSSILQELIDDEPEAKRA